MLIGDVRKAEENRRGTPAGEIALHRARQHVLQKAPKKKFFGPGGEKQDSRGRYGDGFPFVPLGIEADEADSLPQYRRNQRENGVAAENKESPVASPTDGVADAGQAAQQKKRRQGDIHRKQDRHHIAEASLGIRPEQP